MNDAELLAYSPTAQKLIDWFGYIPNFHDAEVVSVELHRDGPSVLKVHTFRTLAETGETGHYKTDKHSIVSISFTEIGDLELLGFNSQNVVFDICFEPHNDGCKISLGGCYGIEGSITVKTVSFDLQAGKPKGSVYME